MTTPRKQPICAKGTYVERMNAAIVFSERQRYRVVELAEEIGAAARAELIERHRQLRMDPPSRANLDTAADAVIEKDARWKNAVGDEQWGYRLTTMYASAELVAATRENTQVLKAIFEAQQTTNRLLKMLVEDQTVPVEPSDPPVPPQRLGD